MIAALLLLAAAPATSAPSDKAFVMFTGPAQLQALCGASPDPDKVRLGCVGPTSPKGVKVIVAPHPCLVPDSDFYAALLCDALQHADQGGASR